MDTKPIEKCLSASDLVKRSALQIRYLRIKREQILTRRMLSGIAYQNKVAVELQAEDAQEFRTTLSVDDLTIFACHDIVTSDYIMEVKSIEEGSKVEDWYIESSLLQTAFYKALLMCSDGKVFTPKFRIKEGYKRQMKQLDVNLPYRLKLGNLASYEVNVVSPMELIKYFAEKGRITFLSREECVAYDKIHKFKHVSFCHDYYTYTKL